MTSAELEEWVLRIIRRVEAGQRVEDSTVELKADWIDAKKAARQIAGLANASRAGRVLWIVGLDEKKGVADTRAVELAEWWPAVKSEFEGIVPDMYPLSVPTSTGKGVTALLFEVERPPYVVKNPAGGAVTHEVPWREGNATRTARRSDLIELLVPVALLPDVSILKASLSIPTQIVTTTGGNTVEGGYAYLDAQLYLTPLSPDTIVIPFHRWAGFVEIDGHRHELSEWNVTTPNIAPELGRRVQGPSTYPSATTATASELVVEGPGSLRVQASCFVDPLPGGGAETISIELRLQPARATIPAVVRQDLSRGPNESDGTPALRWRFKW